MNANDLFTAVMELDLESIKMKLMHVASGEGWSLEKADAVEKEYRRFLCLMKLYPNEDTAPLVDVDTFWHYHILDTMKYAADCERVFGYFLHHYPYVGLSGEEEDEQFRLDSGERMRALYEATFGDAYPESLDVDAQATAYCAGPTHERLGRNLQAGAATAYCAGPTHGKLVHGIHVGTLPSTRSAMAAATAYCAGPTHGKLAHGIRAGATTAYCAGPTHGKLAHDIRAGAATAYCAGPTHGQLTMRRTNGTHPQAFARD